MLVTQLNKCYTKLHFTRITVLTKSKYESH